jgi:subtilisin family serine protease
MAQQPKPPASSLNGTAARRPDRDAPAPLRAAFMIAPRQAPGVQMFSTDFVAQQLRESPDIEVTGQVNPPRLFGLQDDDVTQTGAVLLATMPYDKARQLQAQAGPRLLVERDTPLSFGLDVPRPVLANPGVLTPLGTEYTATLEVLGPSGPLADAEIYVFGSVWPTQGVTDASGRATLLIRGDTPETIRGVYVKPKLDHWGMWVTTPVIRPDEVSTVTLPSLSASFPGFPDQQLLGWGQRAMGLDMLPAGFDGAGIKIAIIDSGAAQATHRNLHHIGPGRSVVADDVDAWMADGIGHGSHCAGIIAGGPVGLGGAGIRGFAPAAEVHAIQIFPGGKFSSLLQAIDYCIENGIDVANLSLGGGEPSQIVEERLIRAKQMGLACIVAAGNSGGPVQFPASTPHVLAVSAIGKWGEFPAGSFHATQGLEGSESASGFFPAKFSCFGPEVDVCGPGVAIVSSLPDDGFGAWDGTSMAAPHITGMAALVLAHHPDFRGAFKTRDSRRVERLFELIKTSATPMSFGDSERTGAGLPNVWRALGLDAQRSQARTEPAVPGDADVITTVRQLIQMLTPATAQCTPQPRQDGVEDEAAAWRNPVVARGPATTGSGGALDNEPAAAQINALRSALQRAGLMARP